jgi:signal transduction histidine kinase
VEKLTAALIPYAARLDALFLKEMKRIGLPANVAITLAKLTSSAAAQLSQAGKGLEAYFEQVEYNGRRLAKLNIAPQAATAALGLFDRILRTNKEMTLDDGLQWAQERLESSVLLTLNHCYYQVREAEAQAFFDLFHGELMARSLDDLLARFVQTLRIYSKADSALVWLNDGSGKMAAAARKALAHPASWSHLDRRSHRGVVDPAWASKYRSCWSVPLVSSGQIPGQLYGVMQFAFTKDYDWLPREQELLTAAAERCVMAMEKARLIETLAQREEEIRALARRMIRIEEVERRRISQELHDESGQTLLVMRLQLEMLETKLRAKSLNAGELAEARRSVRSTRRMAESAILETRRLIAALSPVALEQLGLAAAIKQLIKRFQGLFRGRIQLSMRGLEDISREVEIVAYRIVQECLSNVAKHSRAQTLILGLRKADGEVRILVEDDGQGFDVAAAFSSGKSLGLPGLRERVTLLGGTLDLVSRPGSGTRIGINLPSPDVGQVEPQHK